MFLNIGDDNVEPVTADKSSEEQPSCISPLLCSSSESQEIAQSDEIKSHDEGKREFLYEF